MLFAVLLISLVYLTRITAKATMICRKQTITPVVKVQNRRKAVLGNSLFKDLDMVANMPLRELAGLFPSSGWFKPTIDHDNWA